MDVERFNTIAEAIGFQQIEDEETVRQRDSLPVEQVMALIEQIQRHGLNLMEIELRFADVDDEVVVLTHHPDDETAYLELLEEEESIVS
jgi:hypothetical protein